MKVARAAGYPPRPEPALRWPSIPLAAARSRLPGRIPRMEKFIIEGGAPLSGTLVPAGNKNAALPALAASLLTARRSCCATSRASATWRRWSSCSCASAPAPSGATRTWSPSLRRDLAHRGRRRAVRAHPRLVPARRPAARALRQGRHAAARRRRDRPPPPRSAPGRLPRARRRGARRPLLRAARAPTGCTPATSSWTSPR